MKRNLFSELKEGLAALKAAREGYATLRTIEVEIPDERAPDRPDSQQPQDDK